MLNWKPGILEEPGQGHPSPVLLCWGEFEPFEAKPYWGTMTNHNYQEVSQTVTSVTMCGGGALEQVLEALNAFKLNRSSTALYVCTKTFAFSIRGCEFNTCYEQMLNSFRKSVWFGCWVYCSAVRFRCGVQVSGPAVVSPHIGGS